MTPGDDIIILLELLRRQADLTDRLIMRLTVLELLVGTGESAHLARAADDVDSVAEQLAALELHRTLVVAAVGDRTGLADPTLQELAAEVPDDDLRRTLQDLGARLRDATGEVEACVRRASDVAVALGRAVSRRRDVLEAAHAG